MQHYYSIIMIKLLLSVIITERIWQSLFTLVFFKDQDKLFKKMDDIIG